MKNHGIDEDTFESWNCYDVDDNDPFDNRTF